MNVFEDLIVELKQENLLESTVIETSSRETADDFHLDETVAPNLDYDLPGYGIDDESVVVERTSGTFEEKPIMDSGSFNFSNEVQDYHIHETAVSEGPPELVQGKRVRKGKEFFKKRAMGEVSSLQMVEHVLTGVEREYMKVVPKTFDDFNTKRALHSFLNLDQDVNSQEHATAECNLMRETEAWCTALAERDRHVQASSLRQYCENSRPALSSQALLGLARFYRNLPYSESVRSKFDFVITRLFSRPTEREKRLCLFNRDEMLGHLNMLYSEWSSISLYAAEDDESKVLLTALSFDDLAVEAENASTFDQLIEGNFFGRLRMFKESISELFFAPNVTAAAIDCNIRIGNAYVLLIDRERQKVDSETLQLKYGNQNDLAVSEATGRTLELVDLLRELSQPVESRETITNNRDDRPDDSQEPTPHLDSRPEPYRRPKSREVESVEETAPTEPSRFLERLKENARNVNRWFLAGCLLMIALSFGLYFYATYGVSDTVPSNGVMTVDLGNSVLQDHIKVGKISGEILYGQMQPSWDTLTKEKREDYLKKVYQAGAEKGYKQVNLIGKDGKVVGYASAAKLDVMMP